MGPTGADLDRSLETSSEEKKIEQKYDDPIDQAAYERHIANIGVKNEKRKADLNYYSIKLSDMCKSTMECINSDTTSKDLVQLLKIGNKEWLSICANTRKTNKNLKLNIEAYMKCMVDGLQKRMILTDKKNIVEGEEIEKK